MRYIILTLCYLFAAASAAENGIYVGQPKVYDDYYLRTQLNIIRARLQNLQVVDQSSLLARIGGIQGSTLEQSRFTLQAIGQPTPQVVTTLPALASNPPAASNTQVTTQGALTPSVPAQSASNVSLPSGITPSSLDTLNEQLQLSYQITNFELLLNGALTDRFLGKNREKRRITIGLPITIEPPTREHEGDLAEVDVIACNHMHDEDHEPPSIVMLLPQDNTFNVATLSDNSQSFGLGVIAGIYSVDAGWFHGKQQYYLMKQQDTIALQKTPYPYDKCEGRESVTFAWQFFPAIGSKVVRSSMRQSFVQLAVPPNFRDGIAVDLWIRTAWKHVHKKNGIVEPLEIDPEDWKLEKVPLVDSTPRARDFSVIDLGNGSLFISAQGIFLDGLRTRVGASLFDVSTPNFVATGNSVQFTATAQSVAIGGAYLVGADGAESQLVYVDPLRTAKAKAMARQQGLAIGDTSRLPSGPPQDPLRLQQERAYYDACGVEPKIYKAEGIYLDQTYEVLLPEAIRLGLSGYRRLTFPRFIPGYTSPGNPKLIPLSSSSWQVIVAVDEQVSYAECLFEEKKKLPLLLSIGGKLFGTADAPFLYHATTRGYPAGTDANANLIVISHFITLIVPTDSVASLPQIKIERLFMGEDFESDWRPIRSNYFSAQSLSIVSQGDKEVVLAVSGSDMVRTGDDGKPIRMKLVSPDDHRIVVRTVSPALALVTIPKDLFPPIKQLVFSMEDAQYVALALPEDKKTTPSLKFDNKPPLAVEPGASQVKVTGSNLDQVAEIAYLHQRLSFAVIQDDGKGKMTIAVDLPPAFVSSEGVRYLDVKDTSKTLSRLKVTIKKKS